MCSGDKDAEIEMFCLLFEELVLKLKPMVHQIQIQKNMGIDPSNVPDWVPQLAASIKVAEKNWHLPFFVDLYKNSVFHFTNVPIRQN